MKRLKVIADSDYGKWRDMLNLPTTAKQDRDCLLLEKMGRRFLIDYGYRNAATKLDEEIGKRLEQVSEIM